MQIFGSNQHAKSHLIILVSLLAYLPATTQTVENIRDTLDQSKQLVYIYYDLKGLNYKKEIKITPYIESANGTLTAMQSLSGDFGWVNKGGKNKVVTWDPFKDGITSFDSVQIKVISSEVRDATIPRFRGIMLHGSNSAPFGLKYLQLGGVGFFAGFRMGNLPPSYNYTVTDAGVIDDYPNTGVYEISDEERVAGYAITAGPTFQVGRNVFVYAGAGYGVEQLFWEYEAYDLDKTPLGSEWALNESVDSKGVAVDAGIILRFGRILLDVGGGTIQFKSYQIIGGIGIVLGKNQ